METTKHTLGPWSVDHNHPDDPDTATIHAPDGRYVAHTSDQDADLIAASPDLLAALEAMHKYLITENIPGMTFPDDDDFLAVERSSMAAIAKARGKD